jgi:hypothetical protein
MTTTVRVTRRTPFAKSDALREDVVLHDEAESLGTWLSERDIETVTMGQVLAFAQVDHADAELKRDPIAYVWLWDPVAELYVLECTDRGEITYLVAGSSDPVRIEVVISATY